MRSYNLLFRSGQRWEEIGQLQTASPFLFNRQQDEGYSATVILGGKQDEFTWRSIWWESFLSLGKTQLNQQFNSNAL